MVWKGGSNIKGDEPPSTPSTVPQSPVFSSGDMKWGNRQNTRVRNNSYTSRKKQGFVQSSTSSVKSSSSSKKDSPTLARKDSTESLVGKGKTRKRAVDSVKNPPRPHKAAATIGLHPSHARRQLEATAANHGTSRRSLWSVKLEEADLNWKQLPIKSKPEKCQEYETVESGCRLSTSSYFRMADDSLAADNNNWNSRGHAKAKGISWQIDPLEHVPKPTTEQEKSVDVEEGSQSGNAEEWQQRKKYASRSHSSKCGVGNVVVSRKSTGKLHSGKSKYERTRHDEEGSSYDDKVDSAVDDTHVHKRPSGLGMKLAKDLGDASKKLRSIHVDSDDSLGQVSTSTAEKAAFDESDAPDKTGNIIQEKASSRDLDGWNSKQDSEELTREGSLLKKFKLVARENIFAITDWHSVNKRQPIAPKKVHANQPESVNWSVGFTKPEDIDDTITDPRVGGKSKNYMPVLEGKARQGDSEAEGNLKEISRSQEKQSTGESIDASFAKCSRVTMKRGFKEECERFRHQLKALKEKAEGYKRLGVHLPKKEGGPQRNNEITGDDRRVQQVLDRGKPDKGSSITSSKEKLPNVKQSEEDYKATMFVSMHGDDSTGELSTICETAKWRRVNETESRIARKGIGSQYEDDLQSLAKKLTLSASDCDNQQRESHVNIDGTLRDTKNLTLGDNVKIMNKCTKEEREGVFKLHKVNKEHTTVSVSTCSFSVPSGGQKSALIPHSLDYGTHRPQCNDQHRTRHSVRKGFLKDEGTSHDDDYIRHVKTSVASRLSALDQVEEHSNDVAHSKEGSFSLLMPKEEGLDHRVPDDMDHGGKKHMADDSTKGCGKHNSKVKALNKLCDDANDVQEKLAKACSKNWSSLVHKLGESYSSLLMAETRSNETDNSVNSEEPASVGRDLGGGFSAVHAQQHGGSVENISKKAIQGLSIRRKDSKFSSTSAAHKPFESCSQTVSRLGHESSGSERELISSTSSNKLSMKDTVPVVCKKEKEAEASWHFDNHQDSNMQIRKKDILWQKVFPGLPELAIREKSCYYDSLLEPQSSAFFRHEQDLQDFKKLQATWMGENVIKAVDEHLHVLHKMQHHTLGNMNIDVSPVSRHPCINDVPNAQLEELENTGLCNIKFVRLCEFMQEVKTSMEWIKLMIEDNSCYHLRINDLCKGQECLKYETDDKLATMKMNIEDELQKRMQELFKERLETGSKEEEMGFQNMLQACSSRIASMSRQMDSLLLEMQLKLDDKFLGALTEVREELQTDVQNLELGVLKDVQNLRQQMDARLNSLLEKSESSRKEDMEKVELLFEERMERWLSQKIGTLQSEKDLVLSTLKNELGCLWTEVDGLSKDQKETKSCVDKLTQGSEQMKDEFGHAQEVAKYENTFIRKELQDLKQQGSDLMLEAKEIKSLHEKTDTLRKSLLHLEGEEASLKKQLDVLKGLEESLKHDMKIIKESVERLEEKGVTSSLYCEALKVDLQKLRATLEIDEAKEKALIMDRMESLSHLYLGGLEEARTDIISVKLNCQEKLEDFLKKLENLKREQEHTLNSASLLDVSKRVSNLEFIHKQWQATDREKSSIQKALTVTLYERDTAARAAAEAVESASKVGEIVKDVLESLSSEMVDAKRKSTQFLENLALEREMVLTAIVQAKNINRDHHELVKQDLFMIKTVINSVESESAVAAGAASKAVSFADEAEKAFCDITNRVDSCKYLEKDFSRALGQVLEESQQKYSIKFEKIIACWERSIDKEVKNVQTVADDLKKEKREVSLHVAQASTLENRLEVVEVSQQEFRRDVQRTEKTLTKLTRRIEQVCDDNDSSDKVAGKKEDQAAFQNEIHRLDRKLEEVMKKMVDCPNSTQFQPGKFDLLHTENACKDTDLSELYLKNLEKKVDKATASQLGLADTISHMRRRIHKLESMQINVSQAVEEIRTSTGDLEKSAGLWLPKYESGSKMIQEIKDRLRTLEKSIKAEDKEEEKHVSNSHKEVGGITDTLNQSKVEVAFMEFYHQKLDKASDLLVSKKQTSAAMDAESLMRLEKRVEHVASATLTNLRILDAKVESALEGAAVAESKCSALGAELVRVFRILAASNKGNPVRCADCNKQGEPAMATTGRCNHKTELSAFSSKFSSCETCTHCKQGVDRHGTDAIDQESKRKTGKSIKS